MRLRTATDRPLARSGSARLPTAFGEFTITVYRDQDGKEHLAIHMGDLAGSPALVRIHSECLTGDVFGSIRCDCGEQLHAAMKYIAREGRGLLLYLRQEGRGIGLNNKIRAYALQDQGMDTVQANLELGFPADGRNYAHAAAILKDQGVFSVRLATNNPAKVEALESYGIQVRERLAYHIPPRPENYSYLQTKVSKLGHLVNLLPSIEPAADILRLTTAAVETGVVARLRESMRQSEARQIQDELPSVSLSYAQSLDGSIAAKAGEPLQLSNLQSQAMAHQLRSMHDAVLVGINTVLSDDPRLNVRLVTGKDPRAVVLDSRLRIPLNAKLLRRTGPAPIIATTSRAGASREKRLREMGAEVLRLPAKRNGRIALRTLLKRLYALGIRSLMVEGGAQVITEFLSSRLVDRMIVTIAPQVVGGLAAVNPRLSSLRSNGRTRLINLHYQSFAGDLVVYADVEKPLRSRRAKSLLTTASV